MCVIANGSSTKHAVGSERDHKILMKLVKPACKLIAHCLDKRNNAFMHINSDSTSYNYTSLHQHFSWFNHEVPLLTPF